MTMLSVTTGHENFANGSAKSYVFVVPTTEHPGREVHIGIAAKGGQGHIQQIGLAEHFPAAPGMREEMGRWTKANYEVPDGTVLKVFAQRSGGFGVARVMASQMIRIRREAAYRRLGTVLTGSPKAQFSRVWIEGRFDFLSLEQAARYGIVVPPHFQTAYSQYMVNRAFVREEVQPEIAALPVETVAVVVNSQNEQVEVPVTRRSRALDL